MPNSRFPTDDSLRIKALQTLVPTAGPADSIHPQLQSLVEATASLLGVPISFVSLVGAEKEWFKAQTGLGTLKEARREEAFCDHTIRQDGVLEVRNAREDQRFAENPYVTGEAGLCFYAGAPLVTRNGQRIGALCVMDTRPNALSEPQRAALVRLAGVAVDLLENARAARESALIAAEMVTLNEHSPVGLYAADAVGRCVHVNAKWMEIYGQSEAESLDDGWLARIHPEDRERVKETWAFSVATGAPYDQEFRVVTPVGEERIVRSVARRVVDEDGAISGLVGSVEDVTFIRREARLVDEKRERLSLIVQATGVATMEWNEQTKELRPSPQWAALSGHVVEDFAGNTSDNLCDWVYPEDRPLVRAARVHARQSSSGEISIEFRKFHKSGRLLWVLMRAKVVTRTADGAPEWVFASQIDITDRKVAEEQILKSERLLRQMEEVAGVGGWDLDLQTNS